MVRDLCKCFVGRCEDSIVGCCAVQSLNQIWVLVDELREHGGIFASCNELVDSQVRLAVAVVTMLRVFWFIVRKPWDIEVGTVNVGIL